MSGERAPTRLPAATEVLVAFASRLRSEGLPIAPEQTMNFVEAVGLLGPTAMGDIYRAGRATLAPGPQDMALYDAVFQAHFYGATVASPASGVSDDEEELKIQEARDEAGLLPEPDDASESGGDATASEVISLRHFDALDEPAALRQFRRDAPARLPTRRSRRFYSARRGTRYDLRRSLREAVRRDGELLSLEARRARVRQRQILLLVDVSGSMKEYTDSYLRFAHTLARVSTRIEVFTIGTRLTRITRAIQLRHQTQALTAASNVVVDFDGGTRLGDALQAFLAVPRFAGFARGAVVLMLSDGLERGEPAHLVDAVDRLSRLAWHVRWLTPLAADSAYEIRTEALQAIAPYLDSFGDASSVQRLCADILELSRAA